jgi:hypothetical protein
MDILPRSLPATVVRIVEGLPNTLDQTYKRILLRLRVAEENREHTYHVFHTLTVATRPLTMDELFLVLAIDFIAEVSQNLKVNEDNLLTVYLTLLSFVDVDGSRFGQFAHYSVKDFLTSERILTNETKIAWYRMYDGPAQTTVAQMWLAVLLHLDERTVTDKCAVEEIPMIPQASSSRLQLAYGPCPMQFPFAPCWSVAGIAFLLSSESYHRP